VKFSAGKTDGKEQEIFPSLSRFLAGFGQDREKTEPCLPCLTWELCPGDGSGSRDKTWGNNGLSFHRELESSS
jgi:hypothetical protein